MDLWRVLDRRKIGNAIPRFINDYSGVRIIVYSFRSFRGVG